MFETGVWITFFEAGSCILHCDCMKRENSVYGQGRHLSYTSEKDLLSIHAFNYSVTTAYLIFYH